MAIRHRSPALYTADHGGNFNMNIPDDEAANADAGWGAASALYPTGAKYCKPRHVDGVDASGNHRSLIVADITSPLWDGSADTFSVAGVAYTVCGYVGEKRTILR